MSSKVHSRLGLRHPTTFASCPKVDNSNPNGANDETCSGASELKCKSKWFHLRKFSDSIGLRPRSNAMLYRINTNENP